MTTANKGEMGNLKSLFAFEAVRVKSSTKDAEEIYKLYPRKIGKKCAIFAIKKALSRIREELASEGIKTSEPSQWLKLAVGEFAKSPAGNRGIYTPHPATWFNQSRYLDDREEWQLLTQEEWKEYTRPASPGIWRG